MKKLVLSVIFLLAGLFTFAKPVMVVPAESEKTIEIVFVMDTTGSMGGLIEGAKTKVWSIVNDVLQNQKTRARVKVGLVAYRDRGDEYVTQVTPLNENLDKTYEVLMGFRAAGGGDTPEDVRAALRDGVEKAGWSKPNRNTSQIVFLVGDAPPHNDYKDVPDTLDTAKQARKRGIIINTIQCGNIAGTDIAWRQIAQYGGGEYFAISQSGGTVAIATPYDRELIQINQKLSGYYIAYGSSSVRKSKIESVKIMEANMAAAAPVMAQADRAYNKAINKYAYDESDLIQSLENKTIDIKSIKKESLPENMQKMTQSERAQYLQKKVSERQALKDQIVELSKKRDAYIAEKKKEMKQGDSFDSAVSQALQKQIK